MKKIIFIVGMLTLLISCKMPNDYSDTDISNQTQIENPSSEITDDEENPSSEIKDENNDEENEPSNSIEDEKENPSSEIIDENDKEKESEIIDDSEDIKDEEKDWCKIEEDTDLFSLTYFIHFDGQEVLIDKVSKWLDNDSNFHHLGILKSISSSSNPDILYTFDLSITKSENKLNVVKLHGAFPIKNVYLENDNEIHIVF